MIKKFLIILSLTIALSQIVQPSISWAAPTDKIDNILIGIDEYPPYHSKNLAHFGFGTHIMVEAFAAVGVKAEIAIMPWKRALIESYKGDIFDATIWGGYTDWIDTHYGSDPVFKGEYVLFIRKGLELDFNNPESFKGLTLGNLIGEGVPDQLQEVAKKKGYLEVQSVTTVSSIFLMLATNRIDMIALNRDAGLNAMGLYLSEAQKKQITIHPDPFRLSFYRLVLSNNYKTSSLKLLEKFNAGLDILHTKGRIKEIIEAERRGEYEKSPL